MSSLFPVKRSNGPDSSGASTAMIVTFIPIFAAEYGHRSAGSRSPAIRSWSSPMTREPRRPASDRSCSYPQKRSSAAPGHHFYPVWDRHLL